LISCFSCSENPEQHLFQNQKAGIKVPFPVENEIGNVSSLSLSRLEDKRCMHHTYALIFCPFRPNTNFFSPTPRAIGSRGLDTSTRKPKKIRNQNITPILLVEVEALLGLPASLDEPLQISSILHREILYIQCRSATSSLFYSTQISCSPLYPYCHNLYTPQP